METRRGLRDIFGLAFTYVGNLLRGIETSPAEKERIDKLERLDLYYQGDHPKQIQTKPGKQDDNITLNYMKKIVKKSANMLAGGEIKFDFGEDETAQTFIDTTWDLNKKNKFLLASAKMAGKYGTGYIKILPDYFDNTFPRLERLNPKQLKIFTYEEDYETVIGYRQQYQFIRNNKEILRRIDTMLEDYITVDDQPAKGWVIRTYEMDGTQGTRWIEQEAVAWPYDFPPIVHWQANLTDESVYGESDLEDVLPLQDKINYNASKIGRIIRYHAHPKLWGRGFKAAQSADWGEDEVIVIPSESGAMGSIEMQSDLTSSMGFLAMLVQNLFDITSTVNLATIKDKLGQLTNFGLRVLYQDSLEELYAKRLTFGEMLQELNRRILIIESEGYEGNGGEVIWPTEVVPQDQKEEADLLSEDVNNGFVSKETARGLRGYDNDQELERIQNEQTDLGAIVLNALNRGGGGQV